MATKDTIPSINASYKEVRDFYADLEYTKRFKGNLYNLIKKYTNLSRAKDIMALIDSNIISIENLGTFLLSKDILENGDVSIYKYNKDPEKYIQKVLLYVQKRIQSGDRHIVLTYFLFNISCILYKNKEDKEVVSSVYNMLRTFCLSFNCFYSCNPLTLRVLSEELYKTTMCEVPYSEYLRTVKSFTEFILAGGSISPINIEILESATTIDCSKKLLKLCSICQLPMERITEVLSLTQSTPTNIELNIIADYLCSLSPINVNKELIISILQKGTSEIGLLVSKSETFKRLCIKNIKPQVTYIDKDMFTLSNKCPATHISINYSAIKETDLVIQDILQCCIDLNNVRCKYLGINRNNGGLKVIMSNLSKYGISIYKPIFKIKDTLMNQYNKKISYEISYSKELISNSTFINDSYIEIISDIHADINKKVTYPFDFRSGFTICCGDIASSAQDVVSWVRTYLSNGIVVHGNHLGYNSNKCLEDEISYLSSELQLKSPIVYLNNTCKEHKGIMFLGCCMYTDFSLYGESEKLYSMQVGKRTLNDFRVVKYRDSEGNLSTQVPENYIKMFNESKQFILDKTAQYSNMPIVIVTHFAPSIYSISPAYEGSEINPCFATDMGDVIESRPNIRLWCHGHVHNKVDYIYKGVRVIANPFGYYWENKYGAVDYGKTISINHIKSTKAWTEIYPNLPVYE